MPYSSAGFDHQFFFKRQDLSSYRVKHSKRNSIFTHVHVLFSIYHINCGVLQGFPALRKVVTTHVRKYCIFSTCVDIANQLLTRHFFVRLMNERQSFHDSQYNLFVERSRIMAAKTLKIPYRWLTSRFKLFYRGKKTNILKEKLKVTYSVALVLAFLSAENENRRLEDLSLADFGRLPWKTSSVGKDKVNKLEFGKLKITTIVVSVIMIQRIFPS